MKNTVRFAHSTCSVISLYLCVLTFAVRMKSIDNNDLVSYEQRKIKSDLNMPNRKICFDKKYMMSDLNMSHGKIYDFASFSLFGFTSVIKLRNSDFKIHWNTLTYFGEKIYGVRFEYVPWKMSDFVSFPLLGFTLLIKLRNSDFESHGNIFIFFDKKYWCQIWTYPMAKCLILLHFHCLGSLWS